MKATISDIEPRIIVKENKTENVLNYDIDNAYPQRTHDIVANSGTAVSCLRIYTRFIIGGGFADKAFYKAVINRNGLKVDGLLRKTARDKAEHAGIAWHVNYNQLFEISEVNPVKFMDVRISDDKTKAKIYVDWGRRKKKNIPKAEIQEINWYNPNPEQIQREVEEAGGWEHYKGQVVYWTDLGIEYPVAIYDAVLEDMETEGNAKRFRRSSSGKNFVASQFLVTDEAEDEDAAEEFADTIREFQDPDASGAICIIEKKQPSDTFEMVPVEIQKYDGMLKETETTSKDSIVEAFLIPKPLLLKGSASIGKSDEINDGKEYYNDITYDDRLVIEELAAEVFGRFAFKINSGDDYSILPVKVNKKITQEYFPYVTKNEIRTSIDQPEAEEAKADVKLLAETLGVGGTQSLVSVLINPELTDDQKVGTLEILFGLTKEQAYKMLSIDPANLPR